MAKKMSSACLTTISIFRKRLDARAASHVQLPKNAENARYGGKEFKCFS